MTRRFRKKKRISPEPIYQNDLITFFATTLQEKLRQQNENITENTWKLI